jgi:uncharacterized protein (DUF58 family)
MNYFDNFDIKQVENLELFARQVVEGFLIGLHKSPFHGFSVEFAEHRLYNPGESTKNIDWKVYARTDKLFTKKYEEETNLRCQILIDTSSSMYFPYKDAKKSEINKLKFSCLAAACLMNLLKRQRDAFGISLFDQTLNIHTNCKSSTAHYRLMLSYLDTLIHQDDLNKMTSSADAIHQVADRIHTRSLVIIFSDMLENIQDASDLFSALQHLKYNKHEVILFHVKDTPLEEQFEFKDRPYEFIDMETGEKIKIQSNQLKSLYIDKVAAYKNELVNKCLQYNIDFVDADINEGFFPILQKYLVKRSKLM